MLKFDISELDIGSTPNIDYIGTVESTGGTVEYKTYPIEAPREFMMFLLAMEYDDSKSVLQMQAASLMVLSIRLPQSIREVLSTVQ